MTIYYWETTTGHGKKKFENDEVAIRWFEQFANKRLVLYKESETKDGLPFIILQENN
jgi:hypothetical protein